MNWTLQEMRLLLEKALAWLMNIPETPPQTPYTPPGTPKPATPVIDYIPPRPMLLSAFCMSIQKFEGWVANPPSRSYLNKNPGNLRKWHTQTGTAGGFAVFPTYEAGFAALKELVTRAATGKSTVYKPTDTIAQFFAKYAPSSDNNHPDTYARFVALRLGVEATTFQIKNLIT